VSVIHNESYHGKHAATPEYRAWQQMKKRCCNPLDKAFCNYGGRGITIDPVWLVDYKAFLSHVGRRPSCRHSLDRINNERGYYPGNVRWATYREQAQNSRNVRIVKFAGIKLPLSEWARRLGLKQPTLSRRLAWGWSVRRALTQPVRGVGQKQQRTLAQALKVERVVGL
jgi:hypothetical protein